ncbi:MAG: GAF domain-containing sensor histidine kinase [Chloroflexi bacterium]|nr:GAF domain-containing sensor histidine kinase [Chloroflexota bacterium]
MTDKNSPSSNLASLAKKDPNRPLWIVTGVGFGILLMLGLSNGNGLIAAIAGLGIILSLGGLFWGAQKSRLSVQAAQQLEVETHRLKNAQQRAKAIYELSTTLSSTLDYHRVLEAALEIGALGLRELGASDNARLISTILLFRKDDNLMHVAAARRLTRVDEKVRIQGRDGILGEALKKAEPVIGKNATQDPELRFFVAFQGTNSVMAVPLRAGFENFGVMVFGSEQANVFSAGSIALLTAIATQATIALQNAVLYQNLLDEKERIVSIEEDARKKLARDLHDGPTQTVAMIATRVDLIQKMLKNKQFPAVFDELQKVGDMATKTTKEIRHMLFTLRPLVLETQGLVAALQELAKKLEEQHPTQFTVEADSDLETWLETNVQGVLFYVVEEAANNALKHAKAKNIWIRLYQRGQEYIIIEIEDDGAGFDVEAVVNANYYQRGSLGMVNMRERAELIDAALHIESTKGKGTKISILIPMHEEAHSIISEQHQETARATIRRLAPLPSETRFAARLATQQEEAQQPKKSASTWSDLME